MSDLPRLLLCCFDVVPAPTAISRRLTEYLKGLSERYQVVVLTVKTPDHTHIERYQGARLLRVPVGSGDLAARVQAFDRAVRRQLESEEYVMVHFFDPFGGYALCERRGDYGYKLVYDACSLPSVELPLIADAAEANRRFIARVRRQELFCLMNADVVIVANELTRDFVVGIGVPREQVQVLLPPVDLAPFSPEVMGEPDGTPMQLLHLGNLSDANDLPLVLEAIAESKADVKLVIVGAPNAAHQTVLEQQAASLGISERVSFQAPVTHDDLHKVLAAADVGLLSMADIERNTRVGSPLSRLGEYLAAGRPVIAGDVPAVRKVLPDEGVVLYQPGDKASLIEAIVGLATDPARRIEIGAKARKSSLEWDGAKIRADLVARYVALSGTGVRAVGDEEAVNPDEVTQLGVSLTPDDDTQKRKKQSTSGRESASGTNKVKTDPAIAGEQTTPDATNADRPAVMGVPLREEPPVVLGVETLALADELAAAVEEKRALLPALSPPVFLAISSPTPFPYAPPSSPPVFIPPLSAPPPIRSSPSQSGPPPLPRPSAAGIGPRPSGPIFVPLLTSPGPPPLPSTRVSGQYAVVPPPPLVDWQARSGLFPTPPPVPAKVRVEEALSIDENEIEQVSDEVEEQGEPDDLTGEDAALMTVDTDSSPPPSAIDPWLAQLVHGYCPPESGLFNRHTPPTTMPGRDT